VGLLKRLRGTPIARHSAEFDMRYMSTPPYRILAHRDADFTTVQRMVRFARYWDLIGNSGRFPATLPLLLGSNPFDRFMAFSDWLFVTTKQTHRIALSRLFELLHQYLPGDVKLFEADIEQCLLSDFAHNGLKGVPAFARGKRPALKHGVADETLASAVTNATNNTGDTQKIVAGDSAENMMATLMGKSTLDKSADETADETATLTAGKTARRQQRHL
jgi:hypothetical protein